MTLSKFNCSGMRGKTALDWSKFGAVLQDVHKEINVQYLSENNLNHQSKNLGWELERNDQTQKCRYVIFPMTMRRVWQNTTGRFLVYPCPVPRVGFSVYPHWRQLSLPSWSTWWGTSYVSCDVSESSGQGGNMFPLTCLQICLFYIQGNGGTENARPPS